MPKLFQATTVHWPVADGSETGQDEEEENEEARPPLGKSGKALRLLHRKTGTETSERLVMVDASSWWEARKLGHRGPGRIAWKPRVGGEDFAGGKQDFAQIVHGELSCVRLAVIFVAESCPIRPHATQSRYLRPRAGPS